MMDGQAIYSFLAFFHNLRRSNCVHLAGGFILFETPG
jgi:hypothetical protein